VALTYLYEQAFTNSDWGYASALAVVNLFFVMAVTLLVMWIFRRDPTERRARA
jgi:N-acetylglucosamine transport system permease protein